jgi:hypothetical protein
MRRALLGLIACTVSAVCVAVPINIQVTGTGSGTLGAQAFTNAAFTVAWVSDTSGVFLQVGTPVTAAANAPINIAGQPAASFTSPGVHIFQNSVVGFSQGTGPDLIGYWQDNGYSLTSGAQFGPATIATDSVISQFVNIPTTQGNLTFTSMSNITLQITPNAVPTLGEWGLLLLGVVLAVLAFRSLRRRSLRRA